jgi:hypothetical protein
LSAFLGGRGDKTTQKLKEKTSLSKTTTYLKNIRGIHQTNKDTNTRKTEKKYSINKVQNKQKQKLLFSGLGKFSSHDPVNEPATFILFHMVAKTNRFYKEYEIINLIFNVQI